MEGLCRNSSQRAWWLAPPPTLPFSHPEAHQILVTPGSLLIFRVPTTSGEALVAQRVRVHRGLEEGHWLKPISCMLTWHADLVIQECHPGP